MAGYSQGYPYLQRSPISPHVAQAHLQQFPVVSQAHLQQFPVAPHVAQAQPGHQLHVSSNGTSTANEFMNMDLKILNPSNKKEYRIYTLRHVSADLNSPSKLKDEIFEQCEESVPKAQNMELGYFHHSKKIWINNRLDLNDMWELVEKGEKIFLWCVGKETVSQKRDFEDCEFGLEDKENQPAPKKGRHSNVESQKALVKEYEVDLKKKHEGACTPFQYKLWAELCASGCHTSLRLLQLHLCLTVINRQGDPMGVMI